MTITLLFDFFERSAAAYPDNVAVEVPSSPSRAKRTSITYAQLRREVAAASGQLRGVVKRDAIVAILLPRDSHRLYVAQLAVLESGGAYTCIDTSYPEDRARFILEDSGALLLITDDVGRARSASWGFDAKRTRVIDEMIAAKPDVLAALSPWPDEHSLAYVIYTSGTTGRPKGVLIEQHSIVNLVASDIESFALTHNDRVVQGSSPAYDSSIEETWLAFAVGATLVVMDDETARSGPDVIGWLQRERISVFCPPPTLLRATGCDDPARALPKLRLLYVGGEALPRDLAERWSPGRRLENGYGPTECTVTCVRGEIRDGAPVTIGRAIRGMHAHIVDERLLEIVDGQPGELCLSGVGLARGYLNRPELDAEKFPAHPRVGRIYRTGDLVRRSADGDLECLGRIDSQIKLRGHRIELEEVDLALMRCPGVRAAASRVQGEGEAQILVACIVAERAEHPPPLEDIQVFLRNFVPDSMAPTRLRFVDALPTTSGGKLDRSALPFVEARTRESHRPLVAARDGLERAIADAFRAALKTEAEICVEDDFFHDLGGNSLGAAIAVSQLRAEPATASLAVRDVYEARCVSRLAERARAAQPVIAPAPHASAREPGRPYQVAAAQTLWLFSRLFFASIALYIAVFEVAPSLLERFGAFTLAILAPLCAPAAIALYVFFSVRWAVFLKRRLIGRYEPLRAPVWSGFFLRNWIVQQAVRAVPWRILQGSEFQIAALRSLGATIGERVHLHRGVELSDGGWDLLTIGDDVTVAQDATLRLVELEDGEIRVGPITLEAESSLETRSDVASHCTLERGALLCASSALGDGERIFSGERWEGVPAASAGRAPAAAQVTLDARELSALAHALLLSLGRSSVAFVVGYLPTLVLAIGAIVLTGLDTPRAVAWMLEPTLDRRVVAPAAAFLVADVILSLLLRAALCRALGRVKAGTIPIRSAAHIRASLKTEMLDAAGNWLSGTLFWPFWLRAAGMRVGRNCEISTIIDVVPELVEIGDDSFLADGIYLGGARLEHGVATYAMTRLGSGTFVGNHAVIPGGALMQRDILIGLATNADPVRMQAGSSWFGNPAFELPRRETPEQGEFIRSLTHSPGPLRFASRVFWELLRFALPIVPLFVALFWYRIAARGAGEANQLFAVLLLIPLATLGAAAALCLFVLVLKWILLGRVKPGRHPLWSCWCSRWDFLYVAWAQHAHGALSQLEGTLLLPWYLRAMGCRIGKRTVLGGGFAQVVDPDMLTIEDDATVVGMFQAHTFEDRVLKIDRIRIRRNATVGAGSVLFYGADIGEGAEVAPHSVVMKHERLSAGQFYVGCPTRAAARRQLTQVRASAPVAAPALAHDARWPALDTARGLALVGMIYVHLVDVSDGGPLWGKLFGGLAWLLQAKSAALFCTTAGFSIALLTRRVGGSRRLDLYLLRRSLALFVLGYALAATVWGTEVLRAIACMTLVAGFAARRRPRVALGLILALLAATPVLTNVFHAFVVSDWNEDEVHRGLLSFDAAGLRYLLFDGNYPLVPWLAFPLLGVVLASIDFTKRNRASACFFGFLGVAALLQVYALVVAGRADAFGSLARHLLLNWQANDSPTSVPLMICAGSTAGAILTGLIWWQIEGPKLAQTAGFFRAFGRATLTHYLLHLAVAFALLHASYPGDDWPIGLGVFAFAMYVAVAAPLTRLWLQRFRHGPLEGILARLAGPYRD